MPLDIPTPWLRGPDTLGALSAGGAAGSRAAETVQRGEMEGARLAADAMAHNQRNQLEAARLSQDERIAQMEAATRKQIAQQNQLRENQRMEIEQAYRQAQLGIAKGRLEEQDMIAKSKAKDAADKLLREQNFAAAVAGGMNPMDAYRQYPVSASILNAVARSTKPAKKQQPRTFNVKGKLVQIDPNTGEAKEIYKSEDEGPSILGAAAEGDQQQQPGFFTRVMDRLMGTPKPNAAPASTAGSVKGKVERARALSAAHPDWTKEQIIDAVNKEMQ